MADTSLDDFFAKKDKNKKKSKSKMTPADVLAKAEEIPKKEKKKKYKDKAGGPGLSITPQNVTKKEEEDEEWKDFEEQKEADYSGLRIQTLQISRDDEEREGGESEEDGEGEDGEDRRDGALGPWNKVSVASSPTTTSAPVPEPEEKKEGAKKYIPPAQRQAALNPAAANPVGRRKKEAPNIRSEEDFPTLGGGIATPASTWAAKSKYENSGTGDVDANPGQGRGVNLTLENKFSALQD